MKEIVRNSVLGKVLLEEIAKTNKKIALFGAGTWGKSIVTFFPEIQIDCFVDNKKSGQVINGLNVLSFDDIRPHDSQSLYKLGLGEKDYIFGCGYYGNMLMNTIRHSWRGFIDNNSELWGREINNPSI